MLEPLPPGVVGYHVENSSPSLMFRRDTKDIEDHLGAYLCRSGVPSQQAVIIPIGAAAGGPDASVGFWVPAFSFVKPIALSIQVANFLLAWRARLAARKRRLLLPRITVALFASHIEPFKQTPTDTNSFEAATHLILMLPELRRDLEEAFPALNFRYEIHARASRSERVVLLDRSGSYYAPATDCPLRIHTS